MAWLVRDTAHDSVADLEFLDGRPDSGYSAGTFVGGCHGQVGVEDAAGNHGVGVAEGTDGYFDQDVVGSDVFSCGDFVHFVGLVELGTLSLAWGFVK